MKTTILHIALLIFIFNSFYASAQQRDAIKEHAIELQLQTIDPSLLETFKAATVAYDTQNYQLADSLYSIVYQKAPTFDPAIRRLGGVKTQLGKITEGIDLCEKAVSIKRSYANLITLATMLITSNENAEASTPRLSRALEILSEAKNLPDSDDFECAVTEGQISLQLNQTDKFNTISKHLINKYPDNMTSHYFMSISAIQQEDWETADKEMAIAKSLGLSEEESQRLMNAGVSSNLSTAHYKKLFLWFFLIWVIGFILLYLIGILLSNYTLRLVERQFKTNSDTQMSSFFRRLYRFLMNSAGLYYYISLPVVLVLVIGIVIGIFYLFLMIGRIPIQLMFMIGMGACITVYGMIRSLLVKTKYKDPGRELKESEAPGLFSLTREVATTMGTRAIDEIRITPETDLAVYEIGSWKEKFRDKGKRILILGTGVLKDFKQDEFRAVIAHEYGHFSNRDTAGGAVALRVRKDMFNYYLSLFHAGQAVWWNMAFQFIRLYNFIYGRISNGATRLQEVLADRVAAQTYGVAAFQNGLTYVIRRNIEFVKLANHEIELAKLNQRPFNNLYELSAVSSVTFEEEIKKAMNRETTNDDTHPSPVDRFRFIEGIESKNISNNNSFVRDLFTDWNSITVEMTKDIEDSWKKHS